VTAIDEWLPQYEVSASYSVHVRASVDETYTALTNANLSDLSMVRRLMGLRGYRNGRGPTLVEAQNGKHGPYLVLAVPQREVVLGITGRFWRPDGGIVRGITPPEFADFHRKGYAKAVWNFSFAPARMRARSLRLKRECRRSAAQPR
jgi:hypothetical protein